MKDLYTDEQLIALIANDNQRAFCDLYEKYWQTLFSLVHKRLKSKEASEEIVQNVFMILWEKRRSLEIDCISKYLAAMTKYAVFHYIANEKKRLEKESHSYFSAPNQHGNAELSLNNKLLLHIINNYANALPEKCRLVFRYNKIEDYSINETARILNITPKTAESHLTKALKFLRLRLHLLFFLISF